MYINTETTPAANTSSPTPKEKAVVEIRSSHGGVRPILIYLALVKCDAAGKAVLPTRMTSSVDYVRFRENGSATRRVGNLVFKLSRLGRMVDAGVIEFAEAIEFAKQAYRERYADC